MRPSRGVLVHVETTELQQIESPCRLLARARGAEEDRRRTRLAHRQLSRLRQDGHPPMAAGL
jgi:hypothetical protein